MTVLIRDEQDFDIQSIHCLTRDAFFKEAHSSHTEHYIVDALRSAGVLSISLVAELDAQVVGHVAISPVTIDGEALNWFGLGPISVLPAYQGRGIGSRLMRDVLDRLKTSAQGCVLLGNPDYYGRFGFKAIDDLVLADVPVQYFQALSFRDSFARGTVEYHPAFSAVS